jgi:PAB-dependent poly(A)-specific ribonuclease subunit 3
LPPSAAADAPDALPDQIRQYHSLLPLDDPQRGKRSRVLGAQTSLFRATSELDGEAYTLRRLEQSPLPADLANRASRAWTQMHHPNIVPIVDVFIAQDEGQPLTYIVQPFQPNALTLEQAFLQQRLPLIEETIWSLALQMIAAVHAVHLAGLAVRSLDLSHVLLTGALARAPHRPAPPQASPPTGQPPSPPSPTPLPPHRPQHARIPPTRVAPRPGKDTFRLSSAGLLDLIRPAPRNGPMLQADDLLALARLLVNLACTSPTAAVPQSLQKSLGYIQATFSPELSQLLLLLLSPQATIHDAVAMTSGRMMTRMSQTQAYADALLGELAKECAPWAASADDL